MKKTEKILNVSIVILVAFVLAYIAIWQGIEFAEYNWNYSKNYSVKAFQYLMHGLWGILFSTSPAWWLFGVAFSVKILFKDETKEM